MVDLVEKVLPQEQVTARSLYSGWMVGFISCFSCRSDQPAVVTGSVKRAIILDSSGFCKFCPFVFVFAAKVLQIGVVGGSCASDVAGRDQPL